MPQRQKQKSRRVARFLLVVFLAGAALAAAAWLGGWRSPTGRPVPAIQRHGDRGPREAISETERRSLDEILRKRGSATDSGSATDN